MRPWWLQLGRYARPHVRGLSLVTCLMLLGVALNVLKPWPLKLIVDHALTGEALPDVVTWISDLPGAATTSGLLAWLAGGTVLLFLRPE